MSLGTEFRCGMAYAHCEAAMASMHDIQEKLARRLRGQRVRVTGTASQWMGRPTGTELVVANAAVDVPTGRVLVWFSGIGTPAVLYHEGLATDVEFV